MSTGSQRMAPLHPLSQIGRCFGSGVAAHLHEWRHGPEHVADAHLSDFIEQSERCQLLGGAFVDAGWGCSCHWFAFLG